MQYFKIDLSTDLQVIGEFPQIHAFNEGYDSKSERSCSRIGRYISELPAVMVDFDGLELSRKGKLTDYVSASYLNPLSGLLTSKRLSDFFQSIKGVDFVQYPVKIYRNSTLVTDEYSWLHYVHRYPEFIDFERSEFFLDHPAVNYKRLFLSSYASFLQEKTQSEYLIEPKRLILRKDLVSKFDLLRIGVVNFDTFITETLKNRMCELGFTGLVYAAADHLIVE